MVGLSSYQGRLLTLKKDVWFFLTRNGEQVSGTLFYTGSQKNSAKPNRTASMLLYLLARDEGDEIHFAQMEELVKKKFKDLPGTVTDLLNDFLKSLEECFSQNEKLRKSFDKKYGILETKPVETHFDGTPVPDPMGLFETNQKDWGQIKWEPPDIKPVLEEPIVKKTHFYVQEQGTNGATISRW